MAPKTLAPELTESEKLELARLMEKSKLAETAGSVAAKDVDWSTWRPETPMASGYVAGGQSEGPMVPSGSAIFTPGGITYNGQQRGYQRNRKSVAVLSGQAGGSTALHGQAGGSTVLHGQADGSTVPLDVMAGAMTDGSKRRCPWDAHGPPYDDFELVRVAG